MHATLDLSEIKEMMLQQPFIDVCCLYTTVLVSPGFIVTHEIRTLRAVLCISSSFALMNT